MSLKDIKEWMRRNFPDWTLLQRLLKKNPLYILASAFVIAYFFYSIVVLAFPSITGYNQYYINLNEVFKPPSLAYLFGTDDLGKNIFSEVLAGAPIDFVVSFLIVIPSLFVGLLLGTVAAFYGRVIDEIIMRVTDIFLAFPALILTLAIAAALGPGTVNAIIALLVVWWPVYVRLARGEAITIVSQQYVLAARAVGLQKIKIVFSHVIPNILPPVIAYATADLGNVVINFSVMGFLGLGAQPPLVDLGRLVYDGDVYLQSAPWYSIIPGIVLFVIVISYALVGDMIRDYLDPRSRV